MTDKLELQGRIYMFRSGVEELERYEKGGYHPVHIGDELHHGRYRIVHKLGYGTYSTVWLVRDQHQNQYAALKIGTADVFTDRTEIQVLHRLAGLREGALGRIPPRAPGSVHGHPGREFIAEMLDEFEIQGPNGNHQCIVLEPLGASLSTALYYVEGLQLPLDVSRKVAMQLAEGLSYLHACGIVHGDLHEGNFLFRLPNLSQWSAEQVYSYFGEPRRVEIRRLDGRPHTPHAPEYAVQPPLAHKRLSVCLADTSIRIVDFGESFFSTKCIPRDLHIADKSRCAGSLVP